MAYMSRILFGGLVIDATPGSLEGASENPAKWLRATWAEAAALEARAHELHLATVAITMRKP